MRSVHYLHKNRHIGGSGGGEFGRFWSPGLDLQEPGPDFCRFDGSSVRIFRIFKTFRLFQNFLNLQNF